MPGVELAPSDLRAVTGFAAACARPALVIVERGCPGERRPHDAVEAAEVFARGGERTRVLRDRAWAALRVARELGDTAAGQAARAAGAASGAAFLHPLAKATQVKHVLGSAAHALRAFELAGDDRAADAPGWARELASPVVVDVLRRYPAAPPGGGRVGELIRMLDAALR